MFIAVYRFRLRPGVEDAFAKDWAEVTRRGIIEGKSLGSILGKAQDGSSVAIARWHSKKQRDDWFGSIPVDGARARLRAAIESSIEEIEVEVVADLSVPV